MRIHYFQHVHFEGLGLIADWASERGYTLTSTKLFEAHHTLPTFDDYDALIVMGGPMGVYDTKKYPWLINEIGHIKSAIDANKPVLGICLGAQLIATALGSNVAPHHHKEIGWFPITIQDEAAGHPMLAGLNSAMTVLHWHGDRFEIPVGAIHLASSRVCDNQGFIYRDHVLALQFHLEMDEAALCAIIDGCGHELVEGETVQSTAEILAKSKTIHNYLALQKLLGNWVKKLA